MGTKTKNWKKTRRIKIFNKAYLFKDGVYLGWYQWKEKPGEEEEHKRALGVGE